MSDNVQTELSAIGAFLSDEKLKHPLVASLLTLILGGGAGVIIQPFVLTKDFHEHVSIEDARVSRAERQAAQINSSLCQVQRSQERTAGEQDLRALDKEIYEIEGLISNGTATSRDRTRLVELRSQKAETERSLEILRGLQPCEVYLK